MRSLTFLFKLLFKTNRIVKSLKKRKNYIDFIERPRVNNEFEIHGGALVEKLDFDIWLNKLAIIQKKKLLIKMGCFFNLPGYKKNKQ